MQFKVILNSLFLTFLCSTVCAAPSRDDCKDLKNYLANNKASSLENCKVNSKGEMTELKFSSDYDAGDYSEKLTNEDYKKILSYSTIKKLDFYDEYADCAGLNNGISNLKDLEELNIKSFRGDIAPNVLKDLKSLKSFTYDAGDYDYGELSQENINELSNLSKLEKIKLGFVGINEEKLNFKPLQNLKVSSLTLQTNGKAGINLKGLVENLKELKELTIKEFDPDQKEVDAITSSSKLEKLTIVLDKKIKTDKFKDLKNLTYLNLTIEDEKDVPQFVNTIPNLKTVIFNGKEVTVNNNGNANTNVAGNAVNGTNSTVANGNAGAAANANGNTNGNVATSDSSAVLVRAFTYLPLVVLYLMF